MKINEDNYLMAYEERYQTVYSSSGKYWYAPSPHPVIESFFTKAKDFKKKRVLDVGCGEGRNSLFLLDLGYIVYGVDISSKAISISNQKAQDKCYKYNFHNADILVSKIFANNFFDYIIDCEFSHMLIKKSDRETFFDSCYKLLKKSGILISINNSGHDSYAIEKSFLSEYNYEDRKILMKNSQFKNIKLQQLPTLCQTIESQMTELDSHNFVIVDSFSCMGHLPNEGYMNKIRRQNIIISRR